MNCAMASTTSKVREKERTDETPLEAFLIQAKRNGNAADAYEILTTFMKSSRILNL
jgi:hypothetical protein